MQNAGQKPQEEISINEDSSPLSINPEYENRIKKIQRLQIEITDLLLEQETLRTECLLLERKYMLMLGALECKVIEFDREVRRIRRKIELIQASVNREEKIQIDQIEETLDRELREYTEQIEEMKGKIDEALEWTNHVKGVIEKEDLEKLKVLYRKILFHLHPDLNPNQTDREKKLLLSAMKAFENKDLLSMDTIYVSLMKINSPEEKKSTMDELKEKIEDLQGKKQKILNSISAIRHSWPYGQKDFLDNEIEVQAQKMELEEKLEYLQNLYNEAEEKLKELMKKHGEDSKN
ncbi:MAG: hypothetical protein Q4G69_06505 [Planctomycetia bacterium]|nr:hypothetical protein [Planctomycetia bacterium]